MNSSTENGSAFYHCAFKDHLNLLRQSDYFASLPLEALKVVAYLCETHVFAAAETLFRQGEDDGQAIYLLSGQASLINEVNGQETVVRCYQTDAFIGIGALLAPTYRLYSLRADTEIRSLIITRDKFRRAIEQFPVILPVMIKPYIQRVHAWEAQQLARYAGNPDACVQIAGVSLV